MYNFLYALRHDKSALGGVSMIWRFFEGKGHGLTTEISRNPGRCLLMMEPSHKIVLMRLFQPLPKQNKI